MCIRLIGGARDFQFGDFSLGGSGGEEEAKAEPSCAILIKSWIWFR